MNFSNGGEIDLASRRRLCPRAGSSAVR